MTDGYFMLIYSSPLFLVEHQSGCTMLHAWLLKFFVWFSRKRRVHHEPSIPLSAQAREKTFALPSMPHRFSPPLKVCMLRKIRYRVQCTTSQLSIVSSTQNPSACLFNASQNCADALPDQPAFSIIHCKRLSSVIDINIDHADLSCQSTDKIRAYQYGPDRSSEVHAVFSHSFPKVSTIPYSPGYG